jgi:uncharacterized protein (TIGR03437 family)
LTYSPDADYVGPDSFNFEVSDNNGGVDSGTIGIEVTEANAPPTANDDSVTTSEDTPVPITLSGSDPDGDSLSFSVIGQPSQGTLSGTAPNLTYSPNPDYSGPDSFTFEVSDNTGGSDTGTISVTVTPENDPPQAQDQNVSTLQNNPLPITLGASDPDGDSLGFNVTGGPSNGTLSGTAPNLTYSPDADYVGPDSFNFEVSDNNGGVDSGTIGIEVSPVEPISFSCSPGQIAAGDSTTCQVTLSSPSSSSEITLSVSSNSSDLNVPATVIASPGQSTVSFLVSSDAAAAQQTVVVTVALGGVTLQDSVAIVSGSAPLLSVTGTHVIVADTRLLFNVTAEDPQDLPVTLSATGLPPGSAFHGSIGEFEWRPVESQLGTHHVIFTATNSAEQSSSQTVTIEVVDGSIQISALTNAASFSVEFSCSPGSLATLWGVGFVDGPPESATTFPLPTVLNGIRVLMGSVAANLLYVGSTQINLQCPDLPPGTELIIIVQRVGPEKVTGASESLTLSMMEAAPGIFSLDGSGSGQGVIVISNTTLLAMVANPDFEGRPAHPEEYLTFYATGLGPVDNQVSAGEAASADPLSELIGEVRVKVGDILVDVPFTGLAPGFAGLYQVNIHLPSFAPLGLRVPVKLLIVLSDGSVLESNEVTIAIQPKM